MNEFKGVKPHVYLAGLRLFFNLAQRWEITKEQQAAIIEAPDATSIDLWRKKMDENKPLELPVKTIQALSLIAGIRKSVEQLYPQDRWDEYMKSPNASLDMRSPLDIMEEDGTMGVKCVKEYLESAAGSHYL